MEFSIGPAARSIPEGDSNDLVVELNVETDRAVSVTVASGGGTATAGIGYFNSPSHKLLHSNYLFYVLCLYILC